MPTTRGQFQVPYREHVYGYREEFAPQIGPQVTRVLDVRWNRAGEFVWDLLGWVEYESGSLLRRHLPEVLDSFADSNGNPVLYAVDARLVQSLGEPGIDEDTETLVVWDKEPHADPPTVPEDDDYGWGRYEVTYRPRTYRVLPDGEVSSELERFVTRTETYAATNYTIPGGVFVLEHANDCTPRKPHKNGVPGGAHLRLAPHTTRPRGPPACGPAQQLPPVRGHNEP